MLLFGCDTTMPSISPFYVMSVASRITEYMETASEAYIEHTTNFSASEESGLFNDSPRVYQTALAVVLALFCVITVFGNGLVMAAIIGQQYLHTVTNYFIASLAVADCVVGAIVMPFSAIHEVMDKYWIFGHVWCDLWRSLDVLASTASILNLCAISVDRYWAITNPITYPNKMTPVKAKAIVALVWLCSALISFPAIAWWRAVSVEPYPMNRCPFTNDLGYLIFSSVISFYGPLFVMVFTYYRIYRAAVRQSKSLKTGMKEVRTPNEPCVPAMTLRIHRGGAKERVSERRISNRRSDERTHSGNRLTCCCPTKQSVPERDSRNIKKKHGKIAKERKAAKTLGIVMGVFILCWLPFFIVNVLVGICGTSCIAKPELVSSIVTWLGWLNSGMNPVIYACWSKDFRKAFRRLLCSCFKSRNPESRFKSLRHRSAMKRAKSSNAETFL